MLNIFSDKKKIKKIIKLISSIKQETEEIKMIKSIIDIKDTVARDIMVPRVDAITLNILNFKEDIKEILMDNIVSRIPVYKKNIDNIIGVLHVKELLEYDKKKLKAGIIINKNNIEKYIKDVIFVPESKFIIDILKEFQKEKQHMAIVVDEYGGFSGIITMEDIIEEIIGEIEDEFDESHIDIKHLEKNNYSIDARCPIDKINQELNLNLMHDDVDSLGGFVADIIGRIPKRSELIEYLQGDKKLKFKILSKERNKILRIKLSIISKKKKSN